ncbi:membrane protein [Megasphaera cerevisiae DSM 20462]|uniref:Membrane protein n=1 Tax=Megasphaera cerevisiae DSM 20462 TaxID=1122219 RepID=A0A0J6WVV3_9FIRM|nr:OmpH family outer membrane protein [Megasphaera cerevisiae]KMO86704.1 membrane protein [Megasphaera cerevisiae DSM 20462]OKY53301.1 hypothetical protein BSR42_08270 [Megasphaera cerevisiae]SJZ86202.1 Outer membrane protein (OmpH-like) [Megasphaera cerevisiae DSM 20462]
MKRIYAAAIGAVIIAVCIGMGLWIMHNRGHKPAAPAAPVYAYADLEHVIMSHPRYSTYHHLELEYNAMIAQYQFEQWNYSRQAEVEGKAAKNFAVSDAIGTDAMNQELKAKVALKENELNNGLQQQYEQLLQEKKKTYPVISSEDNLKIVNLQLKLRTLVLSDEERKAAQEQLQTLMRSVGTASGTEQTTAEIAVAMAPYREKAKKELAAYAQQVKTDLEGRRQDSHTAFQQQLSGLQNRPAPEVWNKEWKQKLDAKENEMKQVKEEIISDIREKAAAVAQEQGIDMIFGEYAGVGTAVDVTDDIIAKLA